MVSLHLLNRLNDHLHDHASFGSPKRHYNQAIAGRSAWFRDMCHLGDDRDLLLET